jgi:hypothetical protein
MRQFETTLRNRVIAVQQAITEARHAGDSYTASLHHARLEDLIDLATSHDVDTTGWVDPATMANDQDQPRPRP